MTLIYEYGDRKEKNGIMKGRKEGIKEGRKEGRKEEREKIIKNLYKSGMSCEDIAQRIHEPLDYVTKISNY